MGADQSPKRTAYSGAKALIDALSQANKGYSYVYMQSPEVPKKDMVYVPSPIAAEDNFFAFIPVQRLTKDRKSVFEIYIRCEGPESKTVEYDDSDTFSPKSGERKYLQQVLADMELNPKDWGSYLQNAMGSRYPLVLSSASKDFLVTKHVSGTAPGATNAYSSSKKSFQILGEHLLDFLISRSSGNYVEMGNDTQGKESMRLFLKDLLAVCLTPKTAQEIKDVASGIAKAFVERLKSDLGYAAKMGTQKWQYRNIIGQLQSMPVDPRFKDVYAKINLTQPAYDNLEDRLVEGLAAAITTRKNTLSSLYRGLFQSSSSQEQTSDAEIQRLEGEKQALQAEIEALKAGAPSSDLPSADKTKLEGELSSLSDEKEKAEGNAKFWKIGAIVLTGVGLASGYLIHKAQTKNSIMR
jgi:hypothetical protein